MNEVKWIKIVTDIFDNRKIKQIEQMPDSDALLVIWFKLICLAGKINENGNLYFTEELPYTDRLLANEFNKPIATIQLALQTFQEFQMIEVIDDIIRISNWEKYQNVDGMERIREQTRLRVAKHRENKKLECNVTGNATVTHSNALDKEEDIDIDKDNINPLYPPLGETTKKERQSHKSMVAILQERHFSQPIEEVMTQWLKYKVEKKNGYKETGLKVLLDKVDRLVKEYGEDAFVDVVIRSMEKNYQGIVYEWLEKENPKQDKQGFERFV